MTSLVLLFAVAGLVPVPALSAAPAAESPPDPSPLSARRDDANVDQAWLTPTALTQPAGTLTVENDDVLVTTTTMAPADRVQLSVRVIPSLFDKGSLFGVVAKARVLDVERFHLAVMVGGGSAFELGWGVSHGEERFLSAGATASFCFSPSCRGLVSAYVLANATRESLGDAHHDFARYIYGANAVAPLGARLKLVTELMVVGEDHGPGDGRTSPVHLATGMMGLRVHGAAVAATIGLLAGYVWAEDWITTDATSKTFVVPAISLAGRFGGP